MQNNWPYRILLFAVMLLNTLGAFAQHLVSDTISLEGVTVYQRRQASGLQAGIKSISIDTLVIREKQGLSLAELLQDNSPIFIKTYGRGATATASLRGTSASHTKVYWNGLRINSPMSGEADFSIVPLYFVDDVAIHFGQSSMSFGSGGLGGSVNLQSTPNWGKQYGAKVYQSVGSYQTYSTAATSTYGKGKLKAQTRLFREASENSFSYRNTAKINKPIEIQHNADYLKYGVLQEVYYRYSENSMLSAKAWAQRTDRGIPQLMTSFSAREINRQQDINLNSIVEYRSGGEVVSWRVASGLSHMNLTYDFSKLSVEGNLLPVLSTQSSSWSWYNRASMGWVTNDWITVNVQAEVNRHWVQSTEEIIGNGYIENQTHSALRATLMATPTDRLSLTTLVSEEVFSGFFTPLSASFSFKYRLLDEKSLFANGGYSRNFSYPSLNDLHWQPGGNPNLQPEDAQSWEVGLQHAFQYAGSQLNIEANLFSSNINNWIMWLPHLKGYWEPVNLTQIEAKGAEASLSLNQQIGKVTLKMRGNYSYTKSTIENAGGVMRPEAHGKQIPFIPVHSGGVAINALWRSFHVVYSFTHFSERYTTTSNNPNSVRKLYPYYMSSAAVGWDFALYNMPMGVQLRVDNIFNESYQTILWRPMPGRNYSFTLRVEL